MPATRTTPTYGVVRVIPKRLWLPSTCHQGLGQDRGLDFGLAWFFGSKLSGWMGWAGNQPDETSIKAARPGCTTARPWDNLLPAAGCLDKSWSERRRRKRSIRGWSP